MRVRMSLAASVARKERSAFRGIFSHGQQSPSLVAGRIFFFSLRLIYVIAEKQGSLITSSRCDEVLIPEWPKASKRSPERASLLPGYACFFGNKCRRTSRTTGAPNSVAVWFPSRCARRRPVRPNVRPN